MKMSQQFAGNFLKAADLPQPRKLIIQEVSQTKMPEGDIKPVMKFAGEPQQLVLNKTNAFICVEMFGDESAAWHGQAVELYSTQTSFGGRMVPCIRLRQPQQQQGYQPAPQQQQAIPQQQPVPSPQPMPQQPYQTQQAVPQPMQAPAPNYPVGADDVF